MAIADSVGSAASALPGTGSRPAARVVHTTARPEPGQRRREPGAERDDEHEPERDLVLRDRAEQDDER